MHKLGAVEKAEMGKLRSVPWGVRDVLTTRSSLCSECCKLDGSKAPRETGGTAIPRSPGRPGASPAGAVAKLVGAQIWF